MGSAAQGDGAKAAPDAAGDAEGTVSTLMETALDLCRSERQSRCRDKCLGDAAATYVSQGDEASAEIAAEQMEDGEKRLALFRKLSAFYARKGDFAAADRYQERAVALMNAASTKADDEWKIALGFIGQDAEAGRVDRADRALNALILLAGNREGLPDRFFTQAIDTFLRIGNTEAALTLLPDVADQDERDSARIRILGRCGTETCLATAAEQAVDSPAFHTAKAFSFLRMKDISNAEEALKKAREMTPAFLEPYTELFGPAFFYGAMACAWYIAGDEQTAQALLVESEPTSAWIPIAEQVLKKQCTVSPPPQLDILLMDLDELHYRLIFAHFVGLDTSSTETKPEPEYAPDPEYAPEYESEPESEFARDFKEGFGDDGRVSLMVGLSATYRNLEIPAEAVTWLGAASELLTNVKDIERRRTLAVDIAEGYLDLDKRAEALTVIEKFSINAVPARTPFNRLLETALVQSRINHRNTAALILEHALAQIHDALTTASPKACHVAQELIEIAATHHRAGVAPTKRSLRMLDEMRARRSL